MNNVTNSFITAMKEAKQANPGYYPTITKEKTSLIGKIRAFVQSIFQAFTSAKNSQMKAAQYQRLPIMSFDTVAQKMTEQEKIETAAAFGAIAKLVKVTNSFDAVFVKTPAKTKGQKTMSFNTVTQTMTEKEKRETAAAFGAVPKKEAPTYKGF